LYGSRLCEKLLAIDSTSKFIIIFLPEEYVEQVRDTRNVLKAACPTSQTAGRSIFRVELDTRELLMFEVILADLVYAVESARLMVLVDVASMGN
jgi:hypothetical protein